jgi:phosphopantetheinyl transferase
MTQAILSNPMSITPGLPRGVELIWIDCAEHDEAAMTADLTAAELARADRFRRPDDRRDYIVTHALLRRRLADRLDCSPAQAPIQPGPFGKPALPPGARWRFNLSGSRGRSVIAIAADQELGVDLEYMAPLFDFLPVARRFFSSAEQDRLAALPSADRRRAFYEMWTAHEAALKCAGTGLGGWPSTRHLPWCEVHRLPAGPRFAACLAVAPPDR